MLVELIRFFFALYYMVLWWSCDGARPGCVWGHVSSLTSCGVLFVCPFGSSLWASVVPLGVKILVSHPSW